jgi:hypothetical protein
MLTYFQFSYRTNSFGTITGKRGRKRSGKPSQESLVISLLRVAVLVYLNVPWRTSLSFKPYSSKNEKAKRSVGKAADDDIHI